jgi:DnaJ-class molecular chaperone
MSNHNPLRAWLTGRMDRMKIADKTYEQCPVCENEGEVRVGTGASFTMTCPGCAGLGLIPHQCSND